MRVVIHPKDEEQTLTAVQIVGVHPVDDDEIASKFKRFVEHHQGAAPQDPC